METSVASTTIMPSDDSVSARFPILTRANTGEVFVDASSPFTWSLLGRVVYEGGYRDALFAIGAFTPEDFGPEGVGGCTCVASFGGYVYINLSMSRVLGVRAPGMTTQAIDQSFFGEHPDVPDYTPDPADEDPARSAALGAWMGSVLAPAPDPNAGHRAEIDGLLAERPDPAALSDAELLTRAREVVDRLRPVFATHMRNLYGANIATGLVAQTAAAVGLGDRTARIFAGLGDVDSAQQSFALWSISRVVRESEALTAEFDRGIDGVLDRIGALDDPAARRFMDEWYAFLGAWGYLGPSVWELRSPTYSSEPSIVLHMIDGARKAPDGASPHERSAAFAADREAAVTEVLAALEGSDVHDAFAAAAAVVPALLPAREASKVQCTRLVNEVREVVKELGSRFVRPGLLDHWSDLLMLLDSEVEAFLAEPEAWAATIRERRARLTDLEGRTPPFIVDSRYPALDDFTRQRDELEPARAGDVLRGIGVSPGSHVGRVKVVRSIQDDVDVEPGDVLVALTTDSSWGALFLCAGAVVSQTGATISHAAIVSRELGIPAAVSVGNVTNRLVDGMVVSVDGDSGTVEVLEV